MKKTSSHGANKQQRNAVKITLHSANQGIDEKAEVTVALSNPEHAVERMLQTLAQKFPPESVMTIAQARYAGGFDTCSSNTSSSASSADEKSSRSSAAGAGLAGEGDAAKGAGATGKKTGGAGSSDGDAASSMTSIIKSMLNWGPLAALPEQLKKLALQLPQTCSDKDALRMLLTLDPKTQYPQLLRLAGDLNSDPKSWAQENGLDPKMINRIVKELRKNQPLQKWVRDAASAAAANFPAGSSQSGGAGPHMGDGMEALKELLDGPAYRYLPASVKDELKFLPPEVVQIVLANDPKLLATMLDLVNNHPQISNADLRQWAIENGIDPNYAQAVVNEARRNPRFLKWLNDLNDATQGLRKPMMADSSMGQGGAATPSMYPGAPGAMGPNSMMAGQPGPGGMTGGYPGAGGMMGGQPGAGGMMGGQPGAGGMMGGQPGAGGMMGGQSGAGGMMGGQSGAGGRGSMMGGQPGAGGVADGTYLSDGTAAGGVGPDGRRAAPSYDYMHSFKPSGGNQAGAFGEGGGQATSGGGVGPTGGSSPAGAGGAGRSGILRPQQGQQSAGYPGGNGGAGSQVGGQGAPGMSGSGNMIVVGVGPDGRPYGIDGKGLPFGLGPDGLPFGLDERRQPYAFFDGRLFPLGEDGKPFVVGPDGEVYPLDERGYPYTVSPSGKHLEVGPDGTLWTTLPNGAKAPCDRMGTVLQAFVPLATTGMVEGMAGGAGSPGTPPFVAGMSGQTGGYLTPPLGPGGMGGSGGDDHHPGDRITETTTTTLTTIPGGSSPGVPAGAAGMMLPGGAPVSDMSRSPPTSGTAAAIMDGMHSGGRHPFSNGPPGVQVRGPDEWGCIETMDVEPDGTKVHYIEVPVFEDKIIHVTRKEVVEMERKVPKIEVIETEKIVEIPQVQYVDKQVEVTQIQEVIRHVPKREIVEITREIVKHVPKIETRVIEKVVEVPGELIEVPKPYTVEQKVTVPRYGENLQHTVVAQKLQPVIKVSDETRVTDCKTYEPVLYAVDVYIPKPVGSTISMAGKIDEYHNLVDVPPAQFNSLLRNMNVHLQRKDYEDLLIRDMNGSIPMLPASEHAEIIVPSSNANLRTTTTATTTIVGGSGMAMNSVGAVGNGGGINFRSGNATTTITTTAANPLGGEEARDVTRKARGTGTTATSNRPLQTTTTTTTRKSMGAPTEYTTVTAAGGSRKRAASSKGKRVARKRIIMETDDSITTGDLVQVTSHTRYHPSNRHSHHHSSSSKVAA